uniref:Uncharacterized protein n=1 Tax=Peronospora matthiolae TaxID=2874970 RepID=A0AAV1T0K7_9STRA
MRKQYALKQPFWFSASLGYGALGFKADPPRQGGSISNRYHTRFVTTVSALIAEAQEFTPITTPQAQQLQVNTCLVKASTIHPRSVVPRPLSGSTKCPSFISPPSIHGNFRSYCRRSSASHTPSGAAASGDLPSKSDYNSWGTNPTIAVSPE